jgi:hypothetical protein
MSFILNDTISQQIERGEVFEISTFVTLETGQTNLNHVRDYYIKVGASDVSCKLEVMCPTDRNVIFYHNVANVSGDGTEIDVDNLNLASANTIDLTFFHSPTGSWTGNSIFSSREPAQMTSRITPFNLDTGIILAANTNYIFTIENTGAQQALAQVTAFFRDIST